MDLDTVLRARQAHSQLTRVCACVAVSLRTKSSTENSYRMISPVDDFVSRGYCTHESRLALRSAEIQLLFEGL
jgi:hypothetical protein